MKRLYILRHAKAATPDALIDIERPLDIEGVQDAGALGILMRKKEYFPAQIYCSPALRTRQTLENIGLGTDTNTRIIEPLYDATAGQILECIQDCEDRYNALLVVGHNPAIHELVMRLTSEDSPLTFMKQLMYSYKPGTLSVLDCPCKCWNDLQLAENFLIDFLEPQDYNAPSRPTRWM